MPINYRDLGGSRRLQETVFAGSHDASITQGDACAQTQDLDIAGQANAGVRLFDLRIAAKRDGENVKMVGYHGSPGGGKTVFETSKWGTIHEMETHKKITGEFGLGLHRMLKQAKKFVRDTNEFLIFKFDKCTNYPAIAEMCVSVLGDNIYTPIGKEFSKLTLDDLQQKVVCVFKDKEREAMGQGYGDDQGILGFRSLKGEKNSMGTYDASFPGLQYYGKGGTNPFKMYQTNKMKRADNEGIQREMLLAMANQVNVDAPNVLGMMYWTSTGSLSSIRERNEITMWSETGVRRMGELWREGLHASIANQLLRDQVRYNRGFKIKKEDDVTEYTAVKRLKAYFPNIIMIDFADTAKCESIFDLNRVADSKLTKAYSKWRKARREANRPVELDV